MRDETIIAIVAIISLTIILVVNFFTMKIDSVLTTTIASFISGLGGYHVRKVKEKRERKRK